MGNTAADDNSARTRRERDARETVIYYLLERNAAERADADCVVFEDGLRWTCKQALDAARGSAVALQELGVRAGARVGLFLSNGPDFLRAWWGANAIGATVVPINTSYRHAMLEHVLAVSAPDVVVCDDELMTRLDACATSAAQVAGTDLGTHAEGAQIPQCPIANSDVHSLAFTSGTTGTSKASLTSHLQIYETGSWTIDYWGLGTGDTFLIDLPLFHNAAQSMVVATLAAGGRVALRSAPAMTRYWQVIAETQATAAMLVGSMAGFLLAQPPTDDDASHNLKWMIAAPLPGVATEFMSRFAVPDLLTCYGSTEVSGPLIRLPGTPLRDGSCGQLRPGYEVRLVDERDDDVEPGEVGELIVRADVDAMLSSGYLGDPEATARAWRGGWFHTGDAMRRDDEGHYYFHDRTKDSLRRRGENISSFEVEREIIAYPGVLEAACVAAPGDIPGDDEVKVFVVLSPGADVNFESMVEFLADRMPHFMVPRYYELASSLPKTDTQRVRKVELRARGNTSDTWDRAAHGLEVTRDGLRRRLS